MIPTNVDGEGNKIPKSVDAKPDGESDPELTQPKRAASSCKKCGLSNHTTQECFAKYCRYKQGFKATVYCT